jgi:hypothetical protein
MKFIFPYFSLLTGSIVALATFPTQAAVLEFNTPSINFDQRTTTYLPFFSAEAGFQSGSPVNETFLFPENLPFNIKDNDVSSNCTIGNSPIVNCYAAFNFLNDVGYPFGFFSEAQFQAYLPTEFNDLFAGFLAQGKFSLDYPSLNLLLIAFEDIFSKPSKFIDFHDLLASIIKPKKNTSVPQPGEIPKPVTIPEPATVAGLMLVGGMILKTRRKQINRHSS